jgi:hypothetical protein
MTRCRAAKQDNLEDQENIAKYSPASSPYTAQAFMDVVSPTGAVHTGQIVLQNSKTPKMPCGQFPANRLNEPKSQSDIASRPLLLHSSCGVDVLVVWESGRCAIGCTGS